MRGKLTEPSGAWDSPGINRKLGEAVRGGGITKAQRPESSDSCETRGRAAQAGVGTMEKWALGSLRDMFLCPRGDVTQGRVREK